MSKGIAPTIDVASDNAATSQLRKLASDAGLVEALYVLADNMLAASRILEGEYGRKGLWCNLHGKRGDKLEELIGGFDFFVRSTAVRAFADAWQDELDAAQ